MIRLASATEPHLKNLLCRTQGPPQSVAVMPAKSAFVQELQELQEPDASEGLSIAEWDALFHAVEVRLLASVNANPSQAFRILPSNTPVLVQAIVQECVGALDRLHEALTCERLLRGQLQQTTADAQMAAAKTGIRFVDMSFSVPGLSMPVDGDYSSVSVDGA